MKKHLSFLCLALFLGGMISFWAFMEAKAQIDFFTFFIPYETDKLDDVFDVLTAFALENEPISTTISISVHFSNTIIYYDHWEDGLETDLTNPQQASTLVWGDNDETTNGIPPGFAQDELKAGDVIILQNEIPLPRDSNNLFFDGGDKLIAVGGPLAVTLANWPLNQPSPPEIEIGILYAGAWELYPTNQWGVDHRLPIGEDLATHPTFPRPSFSAIFVNVQAVQDGTTIELDLNADGFIEETVTLNQGQQYISLPDPAQPFPDSIDVRVGGTIRSTDPNKPVQVQLFAIDPNRTYEARAYTPFPFGRWTSELLAPRGSGGDFWLYNPNSSDIIVNVETITQTTPVTLSIPANSTVVYPPRTVITPTTISEPTALYFRAENPSNVFYGVAALDETEDQDWGYAVLPVSASTTQSLVGWGVGNNLSPPQPDTNQVNDPLQGYQSRIYVTALQDTEIYVDYDGDGQDDDSFQIQRLQETPITRTVVLPTKPITLADLTGTYLYTKDQTRFLGVWGQDRTAPRNLPSIDVGTHVVPFPPLSIQKIVNAYPKEISCSEITTPKTVQYLIQYFNNSANQVNDVFIRDELTDVSYVPNTTVIDGVLIPDSGGSFPLAGGGFNIGDLPARPNGNGMLTFDVTIDDPTPPLTITNRAVISSTDVSINSDFALIFSPLFTETESIYQIGSNLIAPTDGVAESGETITYSITITNTGNHTITEFPLSYSFNDTYLTYQQASIPNVITDTAGALKWNDLTNNFGDIATNTTISLMVSFTVNDVPATVEITNTVVGAGGFLDNNHVVPTCKDDVPILLESNNPPTETPTVTPTPSETPTDTPTPITETPTSETPTPTNGPDTTPTPTDSPNNDEDDDEEEDDDGGDDGDGPPTPSVTPPPSGNSTPPPGGTPIADANLPSNDLPVAFLPETGTQQIAQPTWSLIILSLASIALLWGVYHRPRQ